MPDDEYREWLKERGYGEHAIENELKERREERQRHNLPGPAEPKKDQIVVGGLFDRLAKRRRQGDDIEKKR